MKSKIFITPLIFILLLILNPSIALAWDEGVTVASDWEQGWKDDADDFAAIIDSYPGWNNASWAHDPFATWWQEESSGGIDNQKADNVTLSLILSHSYGGEPVEIGFGPGGHTGPDPVRLGYDSPDDYGKNIWCFLIECELFNDDDYSCWYDSMTGTHMLLGFKNSPMIVPGDFKELAECLTGTGEFEEKETIQYAFFQTYVKDDALHDDNIARILAQNEDVADNDYIDTFDAEITVDPDDRIYITYWLNDTTPPAAVTNLSVDTPKHHSLTLHWTSPGDDGNTGTASQYDIRYSTSTINETNWTSATQVTGEPTPLVAGSSQNCIVTGLSANTTYYFSLKTADGIPNWSSISNCTSGTTSWLGDWENCVEITINHTNINEDLTHFPLLIHLSSACGQNSDNMTAVFNEVGANYSKIAVTKDDDQTQLYVEVEKWDSTNKEAWLWVSSNNWTISSTDNTTLYLYYDNSQANNTAYVGVPGSTSGEHVWDSNFYYVDHLQDDPNTSYTRDSTDSNHDGIKGVANQPYEATAKIGDGQTFDGTNDYIRLGDSSTSSDLNFTSANFTLEILCKRSGPDSHNSLFSRGPTVSYLAGYWAYVEIGGYVSFRTFQGSWPGQYTYSEPDVTLGSWYYIAFRRDGGTVDIFINGVDRTASHGTHSNPQSNSQQMRLGTYNMSGNWMKGLLDEARISGGIARNNAWVKATYYSCSDNLVSFEDGQGEFKMGGGKGIPDESFKTGEGDTLPPEIPLPSDNITDESPIFSENNTLEKPFISDNVTDEILSFSDNVDSQGK
jgi:hypothetical protein